MRICYVYDAIYPWETGGVQKRVWEIARRLADDHDVHWYGLKYWDGPATTEREGVTLHGVAEPPDLYMDDRRSIGEALSFTAALAGPLAGAEFDVIDCQEFPYFPAFASKLSSVLGEAALCLTWHEVWGDYWYEYLGRKGLFGKAVERAVATLPDAHLAVSDRTKADLAGLGVADTYHVPNGIDQAQIASVAPADRDVDVLFAGRFIPEKNPELLVEAIDDLRDRWPDVSCTLVGDGPRREAVDEEIERRALEGNVSTLDFREDYEDVLALMQAAEVFVLPSRREGFGITALEALACGTPVVTIDHPQNAATELVDDETGAVTAETPAALAQGIERARSVDGDACVERASRYDWDRIAAQTEATYAAVADQTVDREVTL
ncbi:glycosyltransferase family 4 protein [Halorientalis halophila]|uniref:glycosyltransferase family 4 protein n=1 Tax=Halorientalis halophila TaxID=3108499 RepID=UPI00300B37B3